MVSMRSLTLRILRAPWRAARRVIPAAGRGQGMPGVSAQDFVPGRAPACDGLREAAADCRGCELWEPATQTVFSAGPGRRPAGARRRAARRPVEDQQGEPFVGPAGRLLVKAVDEAGIDRGDDLPHQRGQALPVHPGRARQAADPPDPGARGTSPPAGRGWSRSCGSSTPRSSSASAPPPRRSLLGPSVRVMRDRGALIERETLAGRRDVPRDDAPVGGAARRRPGRGVRRSGGRPAGRRRRAGLTARPLTRTHKRGACA